jgi:hypothetical protein
MGALIITEKFMFPFILAAVVVEEGAGVVLFSSKN